MKTDRLESTATISRLVPLAVAFEGNRSGIRPIGTKLLVKPDGVESKTKGGIELPPDMVERESMARCTGTVIAVGAGAFADWANKDLEVFPKAGDRIFMARYAGQAVDGEDSEKYRLIQDIDVAGVKA